MSLCFCDYLISDCCFPICILYTSNLDLESHIYIKVLISSGFDAFGDVLQPMNKTSPSHGQQSQSGQAAGLGNDLDSSLASLATNLSVGGGANQLKK